MLNCDMNDIYTIFDHTYDNGDFDYGNFELFTQIQYKSEWDFFLHPFHFYLHSDQILYDFFLSIFFDRWSAV